jgi:hypothetical protein
MPYNWIYRKVLTMAIPVLKITKNQLRISHPCWNLAHMIRDKKNGAAVCTINKKRTLRKRFRGRIIF